MDDVVDVGCQAGGSVSLSSGRSQSRGVHGAVLTCLKEFSSMPNGRPQHVQ